MNIWAWCAFYLIVYQHAIHLYHTINAPKRREIIWYFLEYVMILTLHMSLSLIATGFYFRVYLPSLALAWMVSAVSLYMMHAVDLDEYRVHPSLDTRDKLFNWLGDNDGYHLEHSLYPNIHPVYLDQVSALIQPPAEQVLDGQYLTAALCRLFVHHRRKKPAPGTMQVGRAVSPVEQARATPPVA